MRMRTLAANGLTMLAGAFIAGWLSNYADWLFPVVFLMAIGAVTNIWVFAVFNMMSAAEHHPRISTDECGVNVSWCDRERPVPRRRDVERARALIAACIPSRKVLYLPPEYRYVTYGESWPMAAPERYIVHEVRFSNWIRDYRAEIRELDTATGEDRVLDRYQLPVLAYHECRDPNGPRLIEGIGVAPLQLKVMKLMPGQEPPVCLNCGSDQWAADGTSPYAT